MSDKTNSKVVFVRRNFPGKSFDHWLYHWFRDRYRYYKPGGHFWHFKGQGGYFRAALHRKFDVRELRLEQIKEMSSRVVEERFKALFIDSKAFFDLGFNQTENIDFLEKFNNIPVVLLEASASPARLPEDDILDKFDIVFKREHYKDLSRYNISDENREKIRTTMLCCPFVKATRWNVDKIEPAEIGPRNPSEGAEHDVFFCGINTARVREEFVKKLSSEDFDFYGGLQFRKREPKIDKKYSFPRLSLADYREAIRRSRINLALEGEGPFTYRHLETWQQCSFLISTPKIRGLELPIDAREGKHYVCYENYEDLVEKIYYYLEHSKERREIAVAGRKMFERDYDFEKHGRMVKDTLEQA